MIFKGWIMLSTVWVNQVKTNSSEDQGRGSVSSVTQFLTTSKESSPAEAEKQSTTATTSQGSCASINKGHFQAFILSDLKAEILCTLHSIRRKHFRVPCK